LEASDGVWASNRSGPPLLHFAGKKLFYGYLYVEGGSFSFLAVEHDFSDKYGYPQEAKY
jgi:hypothetical protein